jgi:hypothetical protein
MQSETFTFTFDAVRDDTATKTGIAATELPLRVHLGLKLAGPLCAAS